MEDLQKEKVVEIRNITGDYIEELIKSWNFCFGPQMCTDNLCKLQEHVKTFYDELVEETHAKRAYIESEISYLQEEAENLRRLLKTDFELPCVSDDMPLIFVQSAMDKSLEQLREQLRLRREQICELLLEQESFCDELGEPPRELLADPLPSEDEINDFRTHLEQLKELRIERLNQLSTLRREIKNNLQILDLQVSTDTEDRLLNHREIKLNKETFTALQRLHHNYSAKVQELQLRIDEMRSKLHTLWERLETSPTTRKKFQQHTEYSQYTYDIYYGELQRCETLRSQNIRKYVQQIRQEIVDWWDKTLKSEVERNRFTNFNSNNYTDDLLVLHEMELEDLKMYYETNQAIFQLFNERKILWDRMVALELKANEPGRFNNRGGQLLKEEKERKTIATKLPKIEQQIGELVEVYEQREHVPFLVYGENIIDLIAKEWEQKREAKEKISNTRKNGKTPLSKSVISSRTPLSMKNLSTASSVNKMSAIKNRSNMAMTTTQKRKMSSKEQLAPVAKRSLICALNSPSVFRKPTVTITPGTPLKKSASKLATKASRVIASTIRRKSGSHKASIKRRLSQSRRRSKLNTSNPHDQDGAASTSRAAGVAVEDIAAYEYFQKCIEPASRSSIIQHTNNKASRVTRQRQLDKITDDNARFAYLPNPRLARTPSKQNLHDHQTHTIHIHNNNRASPHALSAANNSASSRKLTTKNLPIII